MCRRILLCHRVILEIVLISLRRSCSIRVLSHMRICSNQSRKLLSVIVKAMDMGYWIYERCLLLATEDVVGDLVELDILSVDNIVRWQEIFFPTDKACKSSFFYPVVVSHICPTYGTPRYDIDRSRLGLGLVGDRREKETNRQAETGLESSAVR